MKKELTLKEIQRGSLQILVSVAEICSKLNLTYYLAYGTLIGAIRHQGFIPWDDDIDIMMPRDDYEKLLHYFIKHENELYPLRLFCRENNKKYPYMISRVSNDNYFLHVDNEESYGIGLFIDIYPLDGAGDSEEEYVRFKKKASYYSSLCFLSTRLRCVKNGTKSKFKLAIKYPSFLLAKAFGRDYWMKKLEKMALKYDFYKSKYIGCIVWGKDGEKAIFPRDWLAETVDVPFEGYMFKAPVKYHEILTRLYKDYMVLPSKKNRIAHHCYRAYIKE